MYLQRQMTSFADMATSSIVLAPVITELALDTSPKQLARQLTVSYQTGFIIDLTATSASPGESRLLTQSVGEALATQIMAISPVGADGMSVVDARTTGTLVGTDTAVAAWRTAGLAAFFGLALATSWVLYRYATDDRIATADDMLEITTAPTVARLRHHRRRPAEPNSQDEHEMERLDVACRASRSVGAAVVVFASTDRTPSAVVIVDRLAQQMSASGRSCVVREAVPGDDDLLRADRERHELIAVVGPQSSPHDSAHAAAVDAVVVVVTLRRTTSDGLISTIEGFEHVGTRVLGLVVSPAPRWWDGHRRSSRDEPASDKDHTVIGSTT
ncbi:hypothetical protein [Aeromicrobium sp.]|uniref:YveK family protein n=1 Tax=Aeromicrobium sp. TaxID=1871063 RepID=UPI0025BA8F96|nr:hypothetical protein [Aeromicrobium sp.]